MRPGVAVILAPAITIATGMESVTAGVMWNGVAVSAAAPGANLSRR